MNNRIILLAMALLLIMDSTSGHYCTFLDMSKINGKKAVAILDAYDKNGNGGVFEGYSVCLDVQEPEWKPEKNGGLLHGGSSSDFYVSAGSSFDMPINKGGISLGVTIYDDPTHVELPEMDSYSGNDKDVRIGSVDIQGYNATYCTFQQRVGTRKDLSDRPYYIYRQCGELYFQIDPTTLFTMRVVDTEYGNSSFESIMKIFKSVNITRVEGSEPNLRYLIGQGNRLFDQGKYEEAVDTYDMIATFNTRSVNYEEASGIVDNKGIALYKLGRYNETMDWFDLHNPESSYALDIYGQLLESMGFESQAEYAFDQAAEQSVTEITQVFTTNVELNEGGYVWDEDMLIRDLTHHDLSVRWLSAWALGEMKCEKAIGPLTIALNDTDDVVRYRAEEAIERIRKHDDIEILSSALNASEEEYLGYEDSAYIKNIVSEYGLSSDSRTVSLLIHALGNNTDLGGSYLSDIKDTLVEIRAPSVDPLIQVLLNVSIDPSRRSLAAEALGEIADPRAIDPLIQNLKRDDCDVDTVTVALSRIGNATVEPLIAALNDTDPTLRKNAAWVLGYIEDARSVEPLKELLNDPDPDVRITAERSLGMINAGVN